METINKRRAVQYLDVRGTKKEVSDRLQTLTQNISTEGSSTLDSPEILDGPVLTLAAPEKVCEKISQLYSLDRQKFEFAGFAEDFTSSDAFLLLKNLMPLLAESGVLVELRESGGTVTLPEFGVFEFDADAKVAGAIGTFHPLINYLSCFFDQDFAAVIEKGGRFIYACDVSVFEKTPKDESGNNRMLGKDILAFHAKAPNFGLELSKAFPAILEAFKNGDLEMLVVDLNGAKEYEMADGRKVKRFERDKFIPLFGENNEFKGFMGFADVFMQDAVEMMSPYEGGAYIETLRTQIDLLVHNVLSRIGMSAHPDAFMTFMESEEKYKLLDRLLRDKDLYFDAVVSTAEALNGKRFGEKLELYGISYIADGCVNDCSYCGHNRKIDRKRTGLSEDDMRQDFEAVLKNRPDEFCILAGEVPHGVQMYVKAVKILGELNEKYGRPLKRISLNVAPMRSEEFTEIVEANTTGLPLQYRVFQETYDSEVYAKCHVSGPKSNFFHRYFAQAKALEAGFDSVGIGVLLGINHKGPKANDREIFDLIAHAERLKKESGHAPESVSLPRLKPVSGLEQDNFPVDDKTFKYYLALLRIFLPETKIVLTSRETREFMEELEPLVNIRDLAPRPGVGGNFRAAEFQNELGDSRSAEEVIEDLVARGKR